MKNVPVELVEHQTVVSICLLVRMQPVDSGCLNSDMTGSSGAGPQPTPLSSSPIIDLRGLQALWGHLAPLPAISGRIDRRGRLSAETRGHFQRPPAHFLPPGVPFLTKGTFPFHSLHPPLPFCEQVKDMELVQLLPVISFSLLLGCPHGERGWEISPIQTPHNHTPIWCENLLLI